MIMMLSTGSRNLSLCSTQTDPDRLLVLVLLGDTQLDVSFRTNLVGGEQIYSLMSPERKLLDMNSCTCLKNCSV